MPKQASKIKLSSLSGAALGAAAPAKPGGQTAQKAVETKQPRSQFLPGGILLWCLVGLAIGLSAWLGGRAYLKHTLAQQLNSASSEEVALQSIDALLRLDANATIEVSRGLAHPEFMVANAAFRALGGQLDAWSKLDAAERLVRMQQVVVELERIPGDIDQDHRILVSGLASRIYADALSSREEGAADVLEACRRVLRRTDPEHVPTQIVRLDTAPPVLPPSSPAQDLSPVPPPLAPLDPPAAQRTPTDSSESARLSDQVDAATPKRSPMSRLSLSDSPDDFPSSEPARMHLASGPAALPKSTSPTRTIVIPPANQKPQPAVDPLSASASSRSRVIPQDVQPLPGDTGETTPSPSLSGIEQLPIDQLVRLLSSVQPRVSQAAALTLRQRGMTEENLELAIRLATGSVEQRQRLLSELVKRDDLDARPWLLWMATDGQEVVRQQAVGLLKPLVDNDVRRQLRLLLNKERDEQVAQTIRQVLAN